MLGKLYFAKKFQKQQKIIERINNLKIHFKKLLIIWQINIQFISGFPKLYYELEVSYRDMQLCITTFQTAFSQSGLLHNMEAANKFTKNFQKYYLSYIFLNCAKHFISSQKRFITKHCQIHKPKKRN